MVYSHKGDMHVVARANWTCLKDFFLEKKMEGKERKEKERQKKKVIYRVSERQRPL